MPPRTVLACLAIGLLVAPLAGCVGGSAPTSDGGSSDGTADADDATPGTEAAPGSGDREHVHDRWDGEEEKVLVDETITTRTRTDVQPDDGLASAARDVAFGPDEVHFRPEEGEIVPPGTEKVVVSASWPEEQAPQATRQAALLYRSADDETMQFTEYRTTPGRWTIDTTLEMADGGHAKASVWKFRLELRTMLESPVFSTAPSTEGGLEVDVTVVAHRVNGSLPKEAPHPDWYADDPELGIYSGSGSAEALGAWFYQVGPDGSLYPAGAYVNGTQHTIIPPSTRLLVAEINWTDGSATPGAVAAEPDLQWNNGRFFEWNRWTPETTEPGRHVYELPLEPGMTDGIYPGTSRWRFRYGFFGQDTGVDDPAFGSDLLAPYHFDGSWTITIRAYNATSVSS